MNTEINKKTFSGILMLVVVISLFFAAYYFWTISLSIAIITFVAACIGSAGFYTVQPQEGKVLQLFDDYAGTDRNPGLRWANPLYTKGSVSLRVRNFESGKLKVNDLRGNPIEIAAVVVWRVVDTAEAIFEVDDYTNFVGIQSEAAIRNMATNHPYDDHIGDSITLRGSSDEIAKVLKKEIQDRLQQAGVEVIEARISHLAYAQEIANAMLQRQQAAAIVDARREIVQGAVSIVEGALEQLEKRKLVKMDEDQKAKMVSNLLVVLCGDKAAQPVINND
jgi:regulator of protease activity HflC (stomatin/prohibitin superfamily)